MTQRSAGVLVDDNPPDETKTFVDEGDERDAAEHLDDELGLRDEMDGGGGNGESNQRIMGLDSRPTMLSSLAVPHQQQYIHYPPPPMPPSMPPPPPPALTPVRSAPFAGYPLPPNYPHMMTSPTLTHSQPIPDMSPWASVRPPPPPHPGATPMYPGMPQLQHHPVPPSCQPALPMTSMQEAEANRTPKAHVKKPLNAFMLYMKDMRPQVIKECTLKESAAINQILGKKWHSLDRAEQARYYEMARKERALHQTLYPGWSARDNYATGKKKKKKKDKTQNDIALKKCRARYGLEQQDKWCKPCRRKKKCVRFTQPGDGDETAEGAEAEGAVEEGNKQESSSMPLSTSSDINPPVSTSTKD